MVRTLANSSGRRSSWHSLSHPTDYRVATISGLRPKKAERLGTNGPVLNRGSSLLWYHPPTSRVSHRLRMPFFLINAAACEKHE